MWIWVVQYLREDDPFLALNWILFISMMNGYGMQKVPFVLVQYCIVYLSFLWASLHISHQRFLKWCTNCWYISCSCLPRKFFSTLCLQQTYLTNWFKCSSWSCPTRSWLHLVSPSKEWIICPAILYLTWMYMYFMNNYWRSKASQCPRPVYYDNICLE